MEDYERVLLKVLLSALAWRGRRCGEKRRTRDGCLFFLFSMDKIEFIGAATNGGIKYVQCRSSNLNTSKMNGKKREK